MILSWIKNKYLWAESRVLKYSPTWIKKWGTKNPLGFRLFILALIAIPLGVTAYIGVMLLFNILAWSFTLVR